MNNYYFKALCMYYYTLLTVITQQACVSIYKFRFHISLHVLKSPFSFVRFMAGWVSPPIGLFVHPCMLTPHIVFIIFTPACVSLPIFSIVFILTCETPHFVYIRCTAAMVPLPVLIFVFFLSC